MTASKAAEFTLARLCRDARQALEPKLDASAIEDRRAKEGVEGKVSSDERRKARQGISLGVGKTDSGLLVLLDPRALLPSIEP